MTSDFSLQVDRAENLRLFRGRRLFGHGRSLRKNNLPSSVLLGENSKESIFSAEGFALIRAIDGYVFGQDSHIPVGVKLNMRFARIEHFERAVGPLQVLKLTRFVQ